MLKIANKGGDKSPAVAPVHLLTPLSNNRGKGARRNMTLAKRFIEMKPGIPLDFKGNTPGVGAFIAMFQKKTKNRSIIYRKN